MNKHMLAWLCRRLACAFPSLAALLFCAVPVRGQNLEALYRKAMAEGSVIIYAGGPTAPWDATAKDFSARYPGVNVSVRGHWSKRAAQCQMTGIGGEEC